MTRRLGGALLVPMFATLYGLGFTNLFLRASLGVMAPGLTQEFALTPAMLSAIAAAFFLSYSLMQLPTGMLLDRLGPRWTLAGMLVFSAAGAGVFAAAQSAGMLLAGRFLMGLGLAGTFTGAFFVLNRWLPAPRVVTQIGAVNSFSAIGTLCAATPLTLLIAWIGWRESYWLFTGVVVVLAVAMALLLRDDEVPGASAAPAPREKLGQLLAGVREAARQDGMWRMLAVGVPMSAASTIAGAWGAPYLKDVHGLDAIARGNVLLVMAMCSISGHFLYGLMARRLNTIRGVIVTGCIVITGALSCLAFMTRPPVWLVGTMFCAIALASSYPTLSHAHTRGLVPGHLVGRGVSVTNLGIMVAITIAQMGFGWILGAFVTAGGAPPEIAYRTAFGAQAVVALIALVIYAPVRDTRPSG